MKLFQDTNSLDILRRLYDAQGRRLYDAQGRPLYGRLGTFNDLTRLRYDYGSVHFYGVADAEKTCDYTREGQTVKEDTTAFEDNAASYGRVMTYSDLRIDSADGWTGSFADAKSQANAWLDELMAKANANEIDLLQWIEAGKFSLRAAPVKINGGGPIGHYGQYASLFIRESADARVSTDSLGSVTSATATADVSDRRYACAMLWCFPCCAPGCKLKITVKSSANVSCHYLPDFRGDGVYPDLTLGSYVIKAYPVAADWTNALDAAIPLDRYNVQDIAVPFPSGFANAASISATSWESEIQLTVPPSRILVAVIDPTQFLPWIDSAVRAFPGYERKPTSSSDYFMRSRTCDISLKCGMANATSNQNAVPVAP